MFVSPYLTNPPVLSPDEIAAAGNAGPLTDGAGASGAPYAVRLAEGDGVDVEVCTSAGTASYRAYYWAPLPLSVVATHGGKWVAVGADAASGTTAVSVDASQYNGTAHGRYVDRVESRWWILVREAAAGLTEVFCKMTPARRTSLG